MTRETKVGLLAGMALILLIGILVSDHLSDGQDDPAQMTRFAPDGQETFRPTPPDSVPLIRVDGGDPPAVERTAPPSRVDVIPVPEELTPPSIVEVPAPTPRHEVPEVVDSGPSTLRNFTGDPGRPDVANALPPRPVPVRRKYHSVRAGENLSMIAQTYYGSSRLWREIQKANPKKIGSNGHVRQGVRIVIPDLEREQVLGEAATPGTGTGTGSVAADRNVRAAGTIKVEPGQTLSELAQIHLGSSRLADGLFEANRDKLKDPDTLTVGMVLRLPKASTPQPEATRPSPARPAPASAGGGKEYTVEPGDTLSSIASKFFDDANQWRKVHQANRKRIKDPNVLVPGTKLSIPQADG